jgi:hypothetical protein
MTDLLIQFKFSEENEKQFNKAIEQLGKLKNSAEGIAPAVDKAKSSMSTFSTAIAGGFAGGVFSNAMRGYSSSLLERWLNGSPAQVSENNRLQLGGNGSPIYGAGSPPPDNRTGVLPGMRDTYGLRGDHPASAFMEQSPLYFKDFFIDAIADTAEAGVSLAGALAGGKAGAALGPLGAAGGAIIGGIVSGAVGSKVRSTTTNFLEATDIEKSGYLDNRSIPSIFSKNAYKDAQDYIDKTNEDRFFSRYFKNYAEDEVSIQQIDRRRKAATLDIEEGMRSADIERALMHAYRE